MSERRVVVHEEGVVETLRRYRTLAAGSRARSIPATALCAKGRDRTEPLCAGHAMALRRHRRGIY
jgi:hypothetical protein